MKDRYTVGESDDWLQHSNAELARVVKRKSLMLGVAGLINMLLGACLVWVVYKYSQVKPIEDLWTF